MPATDLTEMYLTELRQRSYTPKTVRDYGKWLRVADRALPYGLHVANEVELRAFIWREDLAIASSAAYHKGLKGFFGWAFEAGELDHNPMANIRRPKVPRGRPRIARSDEVSYVVTQAPQPYRLWGVLAAYGGMRCLEISRAEREHFTPEITTIVWGKGNKPRIVATHRAVWEAVEDLPPGPITELDEEAVSNYFIQYRNRAGLRLSLHRMRGWFCTQGYRATKDIRACQENMGHEDPATTAGYIDIPDDQRKAAIDGLPTFGRGDDGHRR